MLILLFYSEDILAINSLLKLLQTTNCINNVFVYAGKHDRFRKEISCIFCCDKLKDTTPILQALNNQCEMNQQRNINTSPVDEVTINNNHCTSHMQDDLPLLDIGNNNLHVNSNL